MKTENNNNLVKELKQILSEPNKNKRASEVLRLLDDSHAFIVSNDAFSEAVTEIKKDPVLQKILMESLQDIKTLKNNISKETYEEMLHDFEVFSFYINFNADTFSEIIKNFLNISEKKSERISLSDKIFNQFEKLYFGIQNLSELIWNDKDYIFNQFIKDNKDNFETYQFHNGTNVSDGQKLKSNFKISKRDFWEKYISIQSVRNQKLNLLVESKDGLYE